MIGRPASVVVVHGASTKDASIVFANFAACTAYRGNDPLKPSGHFTRQKDRDQQPGTPARKPAPTPTPSATPTPLVVHVGKCTGVAFTDLGATQIEKLAELWLPTAKANAKASADDKRLGAALDAWVAERDAAKAAADKAADDVPF